jgi:hypothetical protein
VVKAVEGSADRGEMMECEAKLGVIQQQLVDLREIVGGNQSSQFGGSQVKHGGRWRGISRGGHGVRRIGRCLRRG